jgi:hypothetical protein
MRALLVASLVVAAAAPAHADDTFEAQAASAVRVKHIDDLVWPFVAKCNTGDDTQQRQCRQLRDGRAAELRKATVLVDGDPSAFGIGTWNAKTKSSALTLAACIACDGVEVDADGAKKKWVVAGGKGDKKAMLVDTARTFADEATAKKYAQSLAGARVQFVVHGTPTFTDAKSIGFEIVGYRVYSPCDGSVIVAKPAATGLGEIDKKSCAAKSPAKK